MLPRNARQNLRTNLPALELDADKEPNHKSCHENTAEDASIKREPTFPAEHNALDAAYFWRKH